MLGDFPFPRKFGKPEPFNPLCLHFLDKACLVVLVSLQVGILDPEHYAVKHKWDQNHHDHELQLRRLLKIHKLHRSIPVVQKNAVIHDLLEKDNNFANEDATSPNKDLQDPNPKVNLFVWVALG